jgi:tripartite-type tricarboxylate transporter receptor subunit TctC
MQAETNKKNKKSRGRSQVVLGSVVPKNLARVNRALICGVLSSMAAVALAASPASSQSADNFYQGKVITLTVGITPGGGYDQYGRLLARHLADHIPGKPTIIVKNMPGAGSLTSVLNLATAAPTDGTQIVTFNAGLLNDSVTDGDQARVKFNTFAWLGSMTRDLRVCVASKSSSFKSWDDLAQDKVAVFGAAGVNSNSANGIAMLRNLFNLKNLRTITAYPGISETNLAVERGEVDGTCASWIAFPENWIKDNDAKVIVRLSPITIPEIPESAKYIGDLVSTPEQKTLVDVLVSSGELARPFILSNKVPPERVEILRKAFADTMTDKDFLADADKVKLPIDPIDGAAAQKIVEKLYSMPADVAEKARMILKE